MPAADATIEAVDGSPRLPGPTVLPGIHRSKLVLGSVAFLALTLGVFWYQFARIQPGDAGPRWADLRWSALLLVLLCLPVETVTSAARTWLICRVLEPGVSFWTCIKAEWANVAISILTPSQSGGGPGQIYVLTRGGASVGTALTIALLTFLGTMVGLGLMGLYSLFVSHLASTGLLFVGAVWSLTAISALMVLAGFWPALFRVALAAGSRTALGLCGRRQRIREWWPPHSARTGAPVDRMDPVTGRLVDVIYTYRDDVRRFLAVGKLTFVWVCLLSQTFLLSRALLPYLCARFLGLEGFDLREVLDRQIALIFLIFFAPTPGGAGIAEGASLSIMATIVPPGFAPAYNLLWRFSTAYLAAIAGFLSLGYTLTQDARALVRRSHASSTREESTP